MISIFTEAILGGRAPVIFGDGTQTRDFVYVGDVAEANVRALGRSIDAPIHIATGIETSVNDLYARLRALTRSTVDAVHGPAVPGEVHRICLGIGRARDLLGWRPRTPVEEGLQRTVEWFKTGRGVPK